MSADVFMFDTDKVEDAIARRGYAPHQAALIREFLNDPKLRVAIKMPEPTTHEPTVLGIDKERAGG